MLWKSPHLYYPEEEDNHDSEDPTGNRPQGTEESEEGTAVNPKLFDFMLKELVPERYLNPEQAMSDQKMEAALGRIRCEEPGRRSKPRRWWSSSCLSAPGRRGVLGQCAGDERARIARGVAEAEGVGLRSHGSKADR